VTKRCRYLLNCISVAPNLVRWHRLWTFGRSRCVTNSRNNRFNEL